VSIPPPKQGLVIRYSYLWHRESVTGQEEGRKDRPCAVVLATKDERVAVVPITTRKPDANMPALELPVEIGKRLGLGESPSWIVANEINVFQWPGEDIRRATREAWVFGQLPPNFTKTVVEGVRSQRQRLRQVKRDQAPQQGSGHQNERRAGLEERLRNLARPTAPAKTKEPERSREAPKSRNRNRNIDRDDDRGMDR